MQGCCIKTHAKIAQKTTVVIGRNMFSAKSKRDLYSYRETQSVYTWEADIAISYREYPPSKRTSVKVPSLRRLGKDKRKG